MQTTHRLLALVAFLATCLASASAQIPIMKVPVTITKPGRYVVKRDLVLTTAAPAAITIAADDVSLDLGGRVISTTLPAGTDVSGISTLGHGGIVVTNGAVRGFKNGVFLNTNGAAVPGVSLDGVRVSACEAQGIYLLGAIASVRRCVIANTGSASANTAIGLELDATFATAVDNDILNTLSSPSGQCEGIHCSVQSGVIENNRVLNEPSAHGIIGIFLGLATDYLVENNRVIGFAIGVRFTNTGAPKFRNNFTTDCTTPYVNGTDAGNNK